MSKKDFTNPADYFLTPEPHAAPVKEDLPEFQVPAGYRLVKEVRSKRLQLLLPPNTVANLKTAAKLEGIQKDMGEIQTDIAVIKNDIKTLYKQT